MVSEFVTTFVAISELNIICNMKASRRNTGALILVLFKSHLREPNHKAT